MKKIEKVMIVGGTHGNEFTGVYLIKKYEKFFNLISRSSFETLTLLANPKSFELVKRYLETDLNRCFKTEDLQNQNLFKYEELLAKKIAQHIEQQKVDFIVDLHSTTANMGLTIILDENPSVLQLAAYLSDINPSVKILQYLSTTHKSFLGSLGNFDLAIEVGAIANGVLNAKIFQETETLVGQILDYIELFNQGKTPTIPKECTVYQHLTNLDYPRYENGDIKAMIAPEIQDYQPLKKGDRLFLEFSGEDIAYQGDSVVYPVFVSEAAYIEKGIAMSLTQKVQIEL